MFNIIKNKKCNIKINDKAEFECVEKDNYIPKSKIEKKIEHFKKWETIFEKHKGKQPYDDDNEKVKFAIRVLKDLLESEE